MCLSNSFTVSYLGFSTPVGTNRPSLPTGLKNLNLDGRVSPRCVAQTPALSENNQTSFLDSGETSFHSAVCGCSCPPPSTAVPSQNSIDASTSMSSPSTPAQPSSTLEEPTTLTCNPSVDDLEVSTSQDFLRDHIPAIQTAVPSPTLPPEDTSPISEM